MLFKSFEDIFNVNFSELSQEYFLNRYLMIWGFHYSLYLRQLILRFLLGMQLYPFVWTKNYNTGKKKELLTKIERK